jgi:site-specific recombinase XerD
LTAFQDWSTSHRGLKDATISNYSRVVRDLIQAVGSEPGSYTAQDLRAFVLDRARRHGPATAELVVTATRVFLRYLVAVAACPVGFEHAIPSVAKWRLARLPRYVPAEDIERVVRLTDDTSPIGARDRAVLLLLARLGLRAADIASLNLYDVDWLRARLRLAGKGRREAWLPLPQDAGDAVLHYLQMGRPAMETSRLFLLSRPPFGPIEPHVVSQIARRGLRRARVESPTRGVRVFRHSLATAMLRAGVPLQTIASVLRHHCFDTTLHYTKVDIQMLKQVASPWPEASPC